ncbi:hypothetical protein SASPL_136915 [Salvia splendens]|uniref:CDP-diacylglycerol--glycerol-3-phosphate 3-phosphatidyltransferase n=1 Tax=Salvia splendens TaxID=180675 RepID=A0A8X8X1H2_SALSN|nr:hypothetical protein SASPL_136915 [Salvia splendens]
MGGAVDGKMETETREESDLPTPPRKSSKLLTLPTILTIGRVAAIPILVYTATTDWLDGFLARKVKLGTPFGAILDPVAEKLMVATTLILLCTKPLDAGIFGHGPWLLTVPATAIICREYDWTFGLRYFKVGNCTVDQTSLCVGDDLLNFTSCELREDNDVAQLVKVD